MIHLTLTHLILVYLVLILGVLFCVWVSGEILRSRRERQMRKNYVICGICDHIYEDRTGKTLLTCPRCGALNERGKVREI